MNRNSGIWLLSALAPAMADATAAGVGVGVAVGVTVGVGVSPGVGVGVTVPSTMRRGEITQPFRLKSNAPATEHTKMAFSRVSLCWITLSMMLKSTSAVGPRLSETLPAFGYLRLWLLR